jgi:hypothetical protein
LVPNPNYVLNGEISATDGLETIVHGFSIRIIPNPQPASRLLKPDDIGRITSDGTILNWEYEDDGYGAVVFDVYLGTSNTAVSLFQNEALFEKDLTTTSIETGELEQGATYYWTVIPKDIFSTGYCRNDVFSFRVNTPPEFSTIDDRTIKPGIELSLNFDCLDAESETLEFSLLEAPEGMELYSNIMTIYWLPTIHQVGEHVVVIDAFDGLEHSNISFKITIEEELIEPDDEDDGGVSIALLVVIILFLVVIMIGTGIGIFLYLKRKKEPPSEEINEDNQIQQENTELDEEGNDF